MKSITKSIGMRIIKDTDHEIEEHWYTDSSGREPEIWCIEGSYINTAVVRRLSCDERTLSMSAWSDAHGDDRGPDHHDHSSGIRIDVKPVDINIIDEPKDNCKFILRQGLKFREEKNGLIIALSLNGFFVNHAGSLFLKFFRENAIFSIDDVRKISNNLGISEEAVLGFLRKLLLFGLVEISNDQA